MTTLVYRFHCQPPTEGADRVRQQMTAAHRYQNDHVAIERGRRGALRACLERLPSVKTALDDARGATRSYRRAARERMRTVLRAALVIPASQRALCRLLEETILAAVPLEHLPHFVAVARIERLAAELRRGARALTDAHWGTYLSVEASTDQIRKDVPLYDDKGEPSDPRFRRAIPGQLEGQVGIHVQNRTLTVAEAMACKDQWVRIDLRSARDPSTSRGRSRYGDLWLRVGSDGRAPVWAKLPIRCHRAIPDGALIKWVRVSCRRRGPWERWSTEITVQLPPGHARPRDLAPDRRGAVALVVEWVEQDGRVRVGRWADDEGAEGELWLDERMVRGLRKAEGIRSVRDLHLNELKSSLVKRLRAHVHHHEDAPGWLRDAAGNGYQWRSPSRFHDLARRWRAEKLDEPRDAYELLQAWELRDAHLYEYESGARRGALGARLDLYRVTAARWAARYRTVILEKRNLSFEARRPNEPGVAEQSWRQLAGVYELHDAMRNAFGPAAVWGAPRRPTDPVDEEGDPLPEPGAEHLLERWREAGEPGGATVDEKAGTWTRRKAAKRQKAADEAAAESAHENASPGRAAE